MFTTNLHTIYLLIRNGGFVIFFFNSGTFFCNQPNRNLNAADTYVYTLQSTVYIYSIRFDKWAFNMLIQSLLAFPANVSVCLAILCIYYIRTILARDLTTKFEYITAGKKIQNHWKRYTHAGTQRKCSLAAKRWNAKII